MEKFEKSQGMFPIGIVANILQVHQRTLRIYNEEGILVPSRSPKNRRLYSIDDIEKGKLIQYLTRELGMNLAGVKVVIALMDKTKIEPFEYKAHILDMVTYELKITPEQQKENHIKYSKRGRIPAHKMAERIKRQNAKV